MFTEIEITKIEVDYLSKLGGTNQIAIKRDISSWLAHNTKVANRAYTFSTMKNWPCYRRLYHYSSAIVYRSLVHLYDREA